MIWIISALVLFIIQILTILIGGFRNPSKTVAWLAILFVFPLIGFVMYYFLASEYRKRRKVRKRRAWHTGIGKQAVKTRPSVERVLESEGMEEWRDEPRLYALLGNMPGAPITLCNEISIYIDAHETYPAMLKAMEQAKDHIHFEFYTVRNDRIGTEFKELLIRKAREGVEVRCIFDGIGSYALDGGYVKELREAGAEVYFFLPAAIAFFDKRINYRNHRKIIVVDGTVGFLGGINIGDEYLGGNPKLGYWRDTHLAMRGDSVYSLQQVFLNDWRFVSGSAVAESRFFPEHDTAPGKPVQVIASGPDAHSDAILEMYFGAITAAKKRVYVTTPYFIPDPSINMGLRTAAASGIDVRVIFPERADSRLVHYASLSYMEELMHAGVRFYAYRTGFIHAKVLLIDDLMASVGTANVDMRSFFSNFELNAVLFDQETIRRLESDFLQDLKNSTEIKLERFERRSRWQKGKEAASHLLSPLL